MSGWGGGGGIRPRGESLGTLLLGTLGTHPRITLYPNVQVQDCSHRSPNIRVVVREVSQMPAKRHT